MKNLSQKIAQSIKNQEVKSFWLTEILNKIEFNEGGTVNVEFERIVLSGDNGRHEFFQGLESEESCFESNLDRLTNELLNK
jgi:hypothetical protein